MIHDATKQYVVHYFDMSRGRWVMQAMTEHEAKSFHYQCNESFPQDMKAADGSTVTVKVVAVKNMQDMLKRTVFNLTRNMGPNYERIGAKRLVGELICQIRDQGKESISLELLEKMSVDLVFKEAEKRRDVKA